MLICSCCVYGQAITAAIMCHAVHLTSFMVFRSKDISAEMWLEELNDAITRATGLDQLGLPQAPLDEGDLTEAELLEQQRVLESTEPT